MQVQRKYREPGGQWTDVSLAEAIGELDSYWKAGTAEPMIREGKTLWTPWAKYRMIGTFDQSLDGTGIGEIQTAIKACQQSFHPNVYASIQTKAGKDTTVSELGKIIEHDKVGIVSAMNILEAQLREAQNLPPAFWRARIAVLDELTPRQGKIRDKYPEGSVKFKKENRKVMALRYGVFPPGVNGQKIIEKKMQKLFPEQFHAWKAGKQIQDQPLSFQEVSRYSTWVNIHPDRILGSPTFDTSRGFPVAENGTSEEANHRLSQLTPTIMEPLNAPPAIGKEVDTSEFALSGGPQKRGRKKRPYQLSTSLIGKYLRFDAKKKSRSQIGRLLDQIQKAISSGKVSASHPHGADMMYMQKKLLALFNAMREGEKRMLKLDGEVKQNFKSVISWKGRIPGEVLLEKFLALVGRSGSGDSIHVLSENIRRSLERKRIGRAYLESVEKVLQILKTSKKEGHNQIMVEQSTVTELRQVLGLEPAFEDGQMQGLDGLEENGEVQIIPSDQIPDNSHLQFDFGPWREIFRSPLPGFWAMVYGRDKLGKSTLVNQFMKYLAHKGHRILWIEFEEDIYGVFNARLEKLKAKHPNMAVAPGIPKDLSAFEFVVINSVSEENLSPKFLTELKKQYKGTGINFILIYKATKDGDYLGDSGHGHLPDIKIEIKKKGRAVTTGRYGVGEDKIPYTKEDWEKLAAS